MGETGGGLSDSLLVKLSEDNTDPLNTDVNPEWITQIGNNSEISAGASSQNDQCLDITAFGDHVYLHRKYSWKLR